MIKNYYRPWQVLQTTTMIYKEKRNGNKVRLLNLVYSKNQHKPKFKVGDQVLMSKYKNIFKKGYVPDWTTKVLITKKKQKKNRAYIIKDPQGNIIKGIQNRIS